MQVMTSNKFAIIDRERPKSYKGKLSTVNDDVNTESYHTSGIIQFPCFSIFLSVSVFVEVIQMMNKPTNVRCINTPNGSSADDTSNSSACESILLERI